MWQLYICVYIHIYLRPLKARLANKTASPLWQSQENCFGKTIKMEQYEEFLRHCPQSAMYSLPVVIMFLKSVNKLLTYERENSLKKLVTKLSFWSSRCYNVCCFWYFSFLYRDCTLYGRHYLRKNKIYWIFHKLSFSKRFQHVLIMRLGNVIIGT